MSELPPITEEQRRANEMRQQWAKRGIHSVTQVSIALCGNCEAWAPMSDKSNRGRCRRIDQNTRRYYPACVLWRRPAPTIDEIGDTP